MRYITTGTWKKSNKQQGGYWRKEDDETTCTVKHYPHTTETTIFWKKEKQLTKILEIIIKEINKSKKETFLILP